MTSPLFSALRSLRTQSLCGESLFTLPRGSSVSSLPLALPSRPATSANPPAATGSTPDPQATSRPSGTADNNSSHSTHTGSSESSSRTAGKAAHTGRERTSPPETQSPFPEIFRAFLPATFSSTNSASPESPDTTDRSLPVPSAALAKPVKAAHEKVFHRNKHCRSR
jgi:hypothetical protein